MYQHILQQWRFHNWMVTTESVSVPKSMDSHDTLKSTAKRKCAHPIYYWVGFHRSQNRSLQCHIGQCHSQQLGGKSSPNIQQVVKVECKAHAHTECVQEEKGRSSSCYLHLKELHTSGWGKKDTTPWGACCAGAQSCDTPGQTGLYWQKADQWDCWNGRL